MTKPPSLFSRRNLLRAAPAAAGLVGAGLVSAQQAAIVADVGQTLDANLDSEDVFAFVVDENQANYQMPIPQLPGFDPPNQVYSLPSPKEVRLTASLVETYRISQHGKLIGTVDVTVPVTEAIEIALQNHLFIRSGTAEAQTNAIIAAFSQYDWNTAPDPSTYAAQKMVGTGVTTNMFAVRQSLRLTKKVGGRKIHDQQRNSLKLLYGQANVLRPTDSKGRSAFDSTDALGGDRLGDRIVREGYKVDLISTKSVGRLPVRPVDAIHQMVGTVASTPNVIDIINAEAKGLDCQLGKPIQKRIATVFAFPEFMIKWDPVVVKIGCVRVTIWVPNLYIRFSAVVLWAYIGNPANFPQFLVSQLEGCAIKAVLTGALIGIVLSNFAAALTAFRVVFIDCVSAIPANFARCLVPGLLLLTEPDGDWKPI